MHLKRCDIKNFRSISDLEITFYSNLQILVGKNESGKSNILKALQFIESDTLPDDDDVRDPGHDEDPVDVAYVRFVFGLERKETNEIYQNLKDKFQSKKASTPLIQIGSKNYSLLEFCNYKKEGLYRINLLRKTKEASYWSLYGGHYTVSKVWRKVPDNWVGYEKFDNKKFKYISIEDYPNFKDDAELNEIKLTELNSVVGAEIIKLVKENIPNCIIWKYSESNLLPGRIDIEKFKADPDICEPLRNIFYLSGFKNISETLTEAQTKSNGVTNLLRRLSKNSTNHLRKVWPEYKKLSITLKQNGVVIEAGIEDEYNVYSLDRRSDGFKRFITFLLLISAEAKADYLKDSLIIIDEPDIGLHPSGVQYLREELKKVAKENNVVIATHSIFMIDKDRIDRHIIVKKSKEVTQVVTDYSSDMLDEEVIYRALGYSLFEMLKQNNIIFEGWTDKKTFQCWINSSYSKKSTKEWWEQYGKLHAFGSKDVKRVASHLEDFQRKYFIISDSDKPSMQYKKLFEGNGNWHTYKDLGFTDKETIEDFLDEGYLIKRIEISLKKEQLDKGIEIAKGTTFNKKMSDIMRHIDLGKKEGERLKKSIKNEIFENMDAKNIDLNKLICAIQKKVGTGK